MTNSKDPSGILKIYEQAIRKVPVLKYSWVLIVTICILTLAAYFKLNNTDVFLYATLVILISFITFIFSFLTKTTDPFILFLLRILVTCIVVLICIAVLSFGSFIIWQEPKFFLRWFPDQTKIDAKKSTLEMGDSSLVNNSNQNKNKDTPLIENKTPKTEDMVKRTPREKNLKPVLKLDDVTDSIVYFTINNASTNKLFITKIYLEEQVVTESHPFGDKGNKIPRENLGLFILDSKGKEISLNDPNYLLYLESNSVEPLRFSFTSKNFNFKRNADLNDNTYKIVGKIYLKVICYNENSESLNNNDLKVYLFDRVIK